MINRYMVPLGLKLLSQGSERMRWKYRRWSVSEGFILGVAMRDGIKDKEGIIGGKNTKCIPCKNVEIVMSYDKRKRGSSHDSGA